MRDIVEVLVYMYIVSPKAMGGAEKAGDGLWQNSMGHSAKH